MRVWKDDEDECVATLKGHRGSVWCIYADATKVVSGSADCMIRLWDRRYWQCVRVLRNHSKTVRCVTANNFNIMSAGGDGKIIMWEIKVSSYSISGARAGQLVRRALLLGARGWTTHRMSDRPRARTRCARSRCTSASWAWLSSPPADPACPPPPPV